MAEQASEGDEQTEHKMLQSEQQSVSLPDWRRAA